MIIRKMASLAVVFIAMMILIMLYMDRDTTPYLICLALMFFIAGACQKVIDDLRK